MVSKKNNSERQFRKDVIKAKERYRNRRMIVVITAFSAVIAGLLISIFFSYRETKSLANEIESQKKQIESLDKQHQVNEVLLTKLNEPEFITDLVRQEYGLSYEGEIIFNLPLQDKFMQTAINSISEGSMQKSDNSLIDNKKYEAYKKKEQESSQKSTEQSDKKESDSNNTNSQTENNTNKKEN